MDLLVIMSGCLIVMQQSPVNAPVRAKAVFLTETAVRFIQAVLHHRIVAGIVIILSRDAHALRRQDDPLVGKDRKHVSQNPPVLIFFRQHQRLPEFVQQHEKQPVRIVFHQSFLGYARPGVSSMVSTSDSSHSS